MDGGAVLVLDCRGAYEGGNRRHPQMILRDLAVEHGLTILRARGCSVADSWFAHVVQKPDMMRLFLGEATREECEAVLITAGELANRLPTFVRVLPPSRVAECFPEG